jgi:uncharacterized membrane protein YdbT with pleckstrin-like domain
MGSYVSNNLISGETVVYETHLHWITFLSFKGLFTLFLAPLFARWTSEFAVTNQRVVIKTGLIARDTLEMNLQKIESVGVDQSLLGRLLGYGDITIIGTGGTREQFSCIADPVRFRRTFQEQVARHG